ncbi:MAG TPA: phenylalanine--tRNA ligase subunit alpha [Actinomycetota bacterium]
MDTLKTAEDALRTLDQELARGRDLISRAGDLAALDEAERAVLGRRSPFAAVERGLRGMSEEDRRTVGRRANEVRSELRAGTQAARGRLEEAREVSLLQADRIDVTLPGRRPRAGSLHPLTITERRIVDIFTRMGYRVVEGPEVETDWYNFQALNVPPDHPARTMRDTIFLDVPGRDDLLLRTETSAMQIRTMERQQPPVYVIAPGRVYRQETPDPTHTPVFHQVEGLAVDEGLSLADLKGTLVTFARALFGPGLDVRFRPGYFPFVEPGAEMDVTCFACGGSGCKTCSGEGWIELLGSGMVHPNVLENVGYDSERYTGFAFGVGIERLSIPIFGIPDIRLFYGGDVRLLEQFQGLG